MEYSSLIILKVSLKEFNLVKRFSEIQKIAPDLSRIT